LDGLFRSSEFMTTFSHPNGDWFNMLPPLGISKRALFWRRMQITLRRMKTLSKIEQIGEKIRDGLKLIHLVLRVFVAIL
jgi:hypothetical protein